MARLGRRGSETRSTWIRDPVPDPVADPVADPVPAVASGGPSCRSFQPVHNRLLRCSCSILRLDLQDRPMTERDQAPEHLSSPPAGSLPVSAAEGAHQPSATNPFAVSTRPAPVGTTISPVPTGSPAGDPYGATFPGADPWTAGPAAPPGPSFTTAHPANAPGGAPG